jgi:hypothetical protein
MSILALSFRWQTYVAATTLTGGNRPDESPSTGLAENRWYGPEKRR